MVSRHTYKKITWIDLERPTQEEVKALMQEFDIHPIVANELLVPTHRPKVDLYQNFIYLILHFPAFQHVHGGTPEQEVDFVIWKNFLITTHYDTIDPLHEFSKVFEVNSIIDKSILGKHAGFVFFYILKELYRSVSFELQYIHDALERIEERIFEGREREMVQKVSYVSRDLLNFKQAIRLHRDVLQSLEIAGTRFFGEDFLYYLRSVTGDYYRIDTELEGNRETVNDLRKTNDSLLSAKQNEIMKFLTVMSFVILPLAFIAQVLSIDFVHLGGSISNQSFWVLWGMMVSVGVITYFFFRKKGWI